MEASRLSSRPKTLFRWHSSMFLVRAVFLTPISPHIYPHLDNNRFHNPAEGYPYAILTEFNRWNIVLRCWLIDSTSVLLLLRGHKVAWLDLKLAYRSLCLWCAMGRKNLLNLVNHYKLLGKVVVCFIVVSIVPSPQTKCRRWSHSRI
jgi:hypothetical protein